MSRQVKGKLRLFVAYMSVLSIGILIYIIVILFANDARNGLSTIKLPIESLGKKRGDSNSGVITSADSTVFVGVEEESESLESSANQGAIQSIESPSIESIESSVADKKSLDDLPNEINNAINAIESPLDSVNQANQKMANSAQNAINSRDAQDVKNTLPRDFIVRVKVLNVRANPTTDAEVIKRFKEGAVIRISRVEGKWAQLENGGWAYMSLLKER